LEDAAFEQEVVPTRIHSLFLPVWKVTVQATVVVAEAGLTTTAELAAFFSLDPILVGPGAAGAGGDWPPGDDRRSLVVDGSRPEVTVLSPDELPSGGRF
jgi:hypothetical protein